MREDTEVDDPRKLEYLNETFGRESALLAEVRSFADSQNREGMQLRPYEGQLLQCLVAWTGAESVLELGTLFGYSALWMASALPAGGRLTTVEKDTERHRVASEFLAKSEFAEKVTLLCGDASSLLSQFQDLAPLDLVFIDANKSAYLDNLLMAEKLVKKGGFIVGDNTLLFGAVYGAKIPERWGGKVKEGMMAFNERLSDKSRYQATMIPTAEGLTVAQKLF